MSSGEYKNYWPVTVLEINREAGLQWKKAGIVFCENNGWDWEGNAYLLVIEYEPEQIDSLERQLANRNIYLYDYAHQQPGYVTSTFGFNELDSNNKLEEMDQDALEICEAVLNDLQINWCGWSGAPSFTIVATENKLQELINCLKEPIEQWQQRNRSGFPDEWEVVE